RNPRVLRGAGGEANPLLSPMVGGVAMALGDRKMFASSMYGMYGRSYQKAMLAGRGSGGRGLPTAGELDPEPGKLRKMGPQLLTIALGAGGIAAGIPVLPGHGIISAGKNIGATLLGERYARNEAAKGVRRGMMPGLRKDTPIREMFGSPAMSHVERSVSPVVNAVRDGVLGEAAQRTRNVLRELADRAVKPRKSEVWRAGVAPLAIGAGSGVLAAAAVGRGREKR
ncbi:MAG: hypothetical protein ACOYOB_20440, partial [Myxococcota bacterium]